MIFGALGGLGVWLGVHLRTIRSFLRSLGQSLTNPSQHMDSFLAITRIEGKTEVGQFFALF